MKILLSPTKKMREDGDLLETGGEPVFLSKALRILSRMRELSSGELKKLWKCNDQLAAKNTDRLSVMNLQNALSPALFAYEGIAFQYMAPAAFEQEEIAYVQKHLRILSAFYGVLKPLDGICPYRLEMQASLSVDGKKDLYDFWGKDLYDALRDEDGIFINLASKEYTKGIEKYLTEEDTFITCFFGEQVQGKWVQKATFAKMARGEMVRYLAERRAESPEIMKEFNRLNFHFREDASDSTHYIFERNQA